MICGKQILIITNIIKYINPVIKNMMKQLTDIQ